MCVRAGEYRRVVFTGFVVFCFFRSDMPLSNQDRLAKWGVGSTNFLARLDKFFWHVHNRTSNDTNDV